MRRIWILTLFPDYFTPFSSLGVIGQALSSDRINGEIKILPIQIRDFSSDKHKNVDDTPFGGGPGMVMRADVLKNALLKGVVEAGGYSEDFKNQLTVIYTSPRGRVWDQSFAMEFAKTYWGDGAHKDLVFVCGRYEGIDERFLNRFVDLHISIGDFILSGGEIAVMAILDSALRLHPKVLGNSLSAEEESFGSSLLEFSHYTKPREFDGDSVPEILLSGHHANIEKYRHEERIQVTKKLRPDLFKKYQAELKK